MEMYGDNNSQNNLIEGAQLVFMTPSNTFPQSTVPRKSQNSDRKCAITFDLRAMALKNNHEDFSFSLNYDSEFMKVLLICMTSSESAQQSEQRKRN